MYVNELIFEVTRRCNMRCNHCMRGEPQNVDISQETVDKALEGITGIRTVTFTGGEPTLAVGMIDYISKQIKKRKIDLGGFFIVTNGKKASRKLMHVLIDLYAYIGANNCESSSVLTISKDQYHDEVYQIRKEAENLYSALIFYDKDSKAHNIDMPIAEGRSLELGLGTRSAYIEPIAIETDDQGNPDRIESTVYINALGDVVPSCDLSFESQKEDKIGNVHEATLSVILNQHVSKAA